MRRLRRLPWQHAVKRRGEVQGCEFSSFVVAHWIGRTACRSFGIEVAKAKNHVDLPVSPSTTDDVCGSAISFSALETLQEALALAEASVGNDLLERLATTMPQSHLSQQTARAKASAKDVGEMLRMKVDPLALYEAFKSSPEACLDRETVEAVLEQSKGNIKGQPALVRLTVPKSKGSRMVIVGDLHGQLNDFLWILHNHGLPSADNRYLFLGDICDRGTDSVKIWMLALAFMIRCPESVTILRGNHENPGLNSQSPMQGGGFATECQETYSDVPLLFQRFHALIQHLPLFAVVEDRLFAVHGGLPRVPDVTLERLSTINISREYPTPRSMKEVKAGVPNSWTDDEKIVFDAQWADPHEGLGIKRSKRGFDSISFGADVTMEFLRLNKLNLIVRGHEVPITLRGFRWHHNEKLLTIFSASKYGGKVNNRGGVLRLSWLRSDELIMETREHDAPPLRNLTKLTDKCLHSAAVSRVQASLDTMDLFTEEDLQPYQDKSGDLLHDIVVHVQQLLCLYREEICLFCRDHEHRADMVLAHDIGQELARLSDTCTTESVAVWDTALGSSGLNVVDSEGLVDYRELLARFHAVWAPGMLLDSARHSHHAASVMEKSMQYLMRAVVKANLTYGETLALFDNNENQQISLTEVRDLLHILLPAMKTRHLELVLSTMQSDWGQKASVSAGTFLATFCSRFPLSRRDSEPWVAHVLEKLQQCLIPEGASSEVAGSILLQKFLEWDNVICGDKSDGYLTREELLEGLSSEVDLEELGLDSSAKISALLHHLDLNGDGQYCLIELAQVVLTPVTLKGPDCVLDVISLTNKATGDMQSLLLNHRASLLRGCRAVDREGSGIIGQAEFVSVVAALLHALSAQVQAGLLRSTLAPEDEVLPWLRTKLPEEVRYAQLLSRLHIAERPTHMRVS